MEEFKRFEGPMVSDLMNRLYTVRPAIHSMTDPKLLPFVAPVCTVRCFPGDNMMVHAALDIAALNITAGTISRVSGFALPDT